MDIKEFIKNCEKSQIINRFGIPITEELIKRLIGVSKNREFRNSQILDLSEKLIKESLNKTKETRILLSQNIIELNTMFKNSAAFKKEFQDILFITLKPEFQKSVKEFRKEMGVDLKGFNSLKQLNIFIKKDIENVGSFIKKNKIDLTEKLNEINSDIKKVHKTITQNGKETEVKPDLVDENYLIKQIVYGWIFNNIKRRMKKFKSIRYPRVAEELLRYHFFFEDPLSPSVLKKYFDEIKDDTRSFYDQNLIGIMKSQDCFELHLLIYGNTTSQEIIQVIKKNWKKVREWQEQLSKYEKPIKKQGKLKDIYRDYLVFKFYKNNFKDTEIAGKMLKYGYNLNPSLIRKIIERVKKRIKNS
jgi:hypothetical protein